MRRLILLLSIALVAASVQADELLNLVNSARLREGGLAALSLSTEATGLALLNNEECIEQGHSGHWFGMNQRRQWLWNHGVQFKYFGEVVALFFKECPTPQEILDVFKASPPHWNALMTGRYNLMSYSVLSENGMCAITIILLEE